MAITQDKDDGVKMALSYYLQQNVSAELHAIKMLKRFPLQLDEAGAAGLIFLTLTLLMGALAIAIK